MYLVGAWTSWSSEKCLPGRLPPVQEGGKLGTIGGARKITGLPSSSSLSLFSTQSFNYLGFCWIICLRSTKFSNVFFAANGEAFSFLPCKKFSSRYNTVLYFKRVAIPIYGNYPIANFPIVIPIYENCPGAPKPGGSGRRSGVCGGGQKYKI